MGLEKYFADLILKVENSEEITNAGKDAEGFYKPKRTILLRHLRLMKDLHPKPLAKPMLKASWKYIIEMVPPDWLVLEGDDQAELKKILE